jgi:dipeptidyl aminopeptidase/acylaminoacyl peptidase
LLVRDDFVKAREKNLGGVEFSPDSKRILFLQNTDIYVLDLEENPVGQNESRAADIKRVWEYYEKAIMRRVDLTPNLLEAAKMAGVQEAEIFGALAEARAKLLNALNEKPEGSNENKSAAQRQRVLQANNDFDASLRRLVALQENYPNLRSNENFSKLLDELAGVENRMNVGRADYNAANNAQSTPKPRRITRTQGVEAGARWLTNDAILYASNGNYFVLNLKETSLVQVTREANPAAFVSVFNVNPTKDGRLVAYVLSDGSKQRALFVPNYLDDFVLTPSVRRGFTEQKVFVTPTDGSREKPFEVNLPKPEGAGFIRGLRWAADNSSLIVDRVDRDLKRRQLFYIHDAGSKAEQIILVTEETDAKWIASLSSLVEPNPQDEAQILFGSEKDGFNHLYLATLERAAKQPNPTGEIRQENPSDAGFTTKVEIKQLTSGAWQVEWVKWMAGGGEFVFSSTEENTAERQFYEFELNRSLKTEIFHTQKGMRTGAQLATEGGEPVLLYEFSKWNAPSELFTIKVCPRCRGANFPQQLTRSTPESFLKMKWNEPKFVDIPTRDGKFVKSKVYLPSNYNQKQKYPMVIFVHGAGYLQNTINGWNNYFREFMFNEMLTQKGYVVLDIDYRGSAGYGRDWRTDVHDFLGGKDYDDHLDAIDYAVKNYAVDAKRVGVYGGSYGGFMAGMLVMRAPDKIAAAAALRPVFDWKNYYASSPTYTAERLGFPEKNPEAYKRSSPIAYAENLQKPLLILHGLVDDNVHAQDSIQLIEKLMRLEKTQYFEAMLYPSENHGFTRPTSWIDEYERIFAFFEKHLKN